MKVLSDFILWSLKKNCSLFYANLNGDNFPPISMNRWTLSIYTYSIRIILKVNCLNQGNVNRETISLKLNWRFWELNLIKKILSALYWDDDKPKNLNEKLNNVSQNGEWLNQKILRWFIHKYGYIGVPKPTNKQNRQTNNSVGRIYRNKYVYSTKLIQHK